MGRAAAEAARRNATRPSQLQTNQLEATRALRPEQASSRSKHLKAPLDATSDGASGCGRAGGAARPQSSQADICMASNRLLLIGVMIRTAGRR
jgi:hypothetical protein